MRITIQIDDHLHAEAKKWALERGTTLTGLIAGSLREALASRHKSFRMITFTGKGVQRGVDLDNSAALLDRMEGVDKAESGAGAAIF
jgi:hypothetical protein